MSIQGRRERERAERKQLIVTAARELAEAEAEGWDAVTTRRLPAEIEYSQPVLYSHFKGKDAIMAAVAVQGFAEMAAELRAARAAVEGTRESLAAAEAYTSLGRRRPAPYDAMFTHRVDLPFATQEAPKALWAAFGELLQAVEPTATGDDDPGTLTETFWAGGLHGLVTLMRSGRLPEGSRETTPALLVSHFATP